jgi:GDP-L-fucose synthase
MWRAGRDIPIADPATLIVEGVGYCGPIHWGSTKPEWAPQKLLNIAKITSLGWSLGISFRGGLEAVYAWYGTAKGSR